MKHVLKCSGYPLAKTDIVRAAGAYLYDAHGRRYVDCEAGVWCAVLGHSHPRVTQAIQRQAAQLMHVGLHYVHDIVETAAMTVLDSLDMSDGHCVFLSSGSEAVEFGVQVARQITGRPLLLALSDAYLAAYGSAGRQDPDEWQRFDWRPCLACPHPERCAPTCPHLQALPFERVGAFVFEPGSSSGLVQFPPQPVVQTLARTVQARGGLVVVDEVTTGMGRTGAWYGLEHYGLQADVVALGKGLGNGYPVSAVALRPALAQRLEAKGFHYAQSHQNDPLACTVAQTVIETIQAEGLVARSRRVGATFLRALEDLAARHACVQGARGRGLMLALQFKDVGREKLDAAFDALLEGGFLVGYKPAFSLFRFYPPLIIEKDDVARLVETLDGILREL